MPIELLLNAVDCNILFDVNLLISKYRNSFNHVRLPINYSFNFYAKIQPNNEKRKRKKTWTEAHHEKYDYLHHITSIFIRIFFTHH